MDFFYDGGNQVRPSRDYYNICLNGILKQLKKFSKTNFLLLQEVDINSKRSYYSNQKELFTKQLHSYSAYYAINYQTRYVPVPLINPLGKILSCQMTFSKCKASNAIQIPYPSSIPWPRSYFFPKRCILITKYKIQNKELVIINTHNSAYYDGKKLREDEIQFLKLIIEKEYLLGNYVIVGGDWNQNPTDFDSSTIIDEPLVEIHIGSLPENWPAKDWQCAYDRFNVTNRGADKPYLKSCSKTTIFDYFIVSPNIIIEEVNVYKLNFEFSDHNPVELKFRLT
jgi:endonuclease/exonuclease/phosphatase family metal-dependent hydrolase